MKFKYYHANSRLNTTDESSDKSKDFHIEFIEALNNLNIKSGNREFILNPLDIIISKHFKNVFIESQEDSATLRWFSINIEYPNPLNRYLVADNALIHDLMNDKSTEVNYVVFRNLNLKICHNYLNNLQIIAEQPKQDPYFNFQAQRITGLLFTELLHFHRQKIAKSISSFPSSNVKYASRDSQSGAIMTYISENNGKVTLKQMAKHFGYQPNYLSRLCKTLFGLDFIHLRLNIRMNLACEHLRLSNMSISEISDELGYKEATTFIQNFIKAKHMTPAAYRQYYQRQYNPEKSNLEDP